MKSNLGKKPDASGATRNSAPESRDRAAGTHVHTGLDVEEMTRGLIDNLHYRLAKTPQLATRNDWYTALAYTVRDRMLERYIKTLEAMTAHPTAKVVAYLSAEFLTGPHLGNGLVNLGMWSAAQQAVSAVGQDLSA